MSIKHQADVLVDVDLLFSGAVTSVTATLYTAAATGAFSLSGTTVTVTTSGSHAYCSCSVAGLGNGSRCYITATGTVGGASETQRSAVRVIDATVASRLADVRDVNGNLPADVRSVNSFTIGINGLASMALDYDTNGWIGADLRGINGDPIAFAAGDLSTTRLSLLDAAITSRASGTAATSIQTALAALQNQTDTALAVPGQIVVPETGTITHRIESIFTDADNANTLINMDAVTLTAASATGTDRSSRLSAATNVSTGRYRWTYTSTAGDAQEQLVFDVVGTLAGNGTWRNVAASQVVDQAIEQFTASDRATLNNRASQATADAINAKTTNLPADPASNTQVLTRMGTFTYTAPPTTDAIAGAILVTPANKLATDSTGRVNVLSLPSPAPSGYGGTGGGTIDTDEIVAAVVAALADREITIVGPVLEDGTLDLVAGDAYTDTRAIVVTVDGYLGAAITVAQMRFLRRDLYLRDGDETVSTLTLTGTASVAGTVLTLTFTPTAVQTATLDDTRGGKGLATYQAQIVDAVGNVTLWSGLAVVRRRIDVT